MGGKEGGKGRGKREENRRQNVKMKIITPQVERKKKRPGI